MTVDRIVVSNARGERGEVGPASGPLGSGSVEAPHVTNDSVKLEAVRAKLGVEKIAAGYLGSNEMQVIDTYLAGSEISAAIGPLYIAHNVGGADGIIVDAGGNFPPGIAFRAAEGTLESPTVVLVGKQLGYIDFRGGNDDGLGGFLLYNSASLDALVASDIPFDPGETPPSFMRFSACKDVTVGAEEAMRVGPYGVDNFSLWVNVIHGEEADTPSGGVQPTVHAATRLDDYNFNFESKHPTNNYGGRIKLLTEGAGDLFIAMLSGATFKNMFWGDGKTSLGHSAAAVCTLDVGGPVRVKSYTVATVPSAAAGAGQIIYVSDAATTPTLAFSDGTNWKRAEVSATTIS